MPNGQYPVLAAGGDFTADIVQAFSPFRAWKTGNTARSTTGNSNDPDLVLALAANATYDVRCVILYSNSAGGMSWGFSAPSGSSGSFGAWFNLAGTGVTSIAYGWTAATGTAAAAGQVIEIEGCIFTGGTAGNLAFQWAAFTSGDSVSVINGSKLIAARAL
jgi:hypothetical protein